MKNKDKALICLGAGNSQLELIKKAKSLGFKIVSVDKKLNSPGSKLSDIFINLSTYNSVPIIYELKKLTNNYNFLGILLRSSGIPVVTASKICKALNIPHLPIKSAQHLVNKDLFRSECLKLNLPVPKFQIIDIKNISNLEFPSTPFIIKPALSLIGKSGISLVNSMKDAEKGVRLASRTTTNNKILIEEYLPGPDYVLGSFINNKEFIPICFLQEINKIDSSGILTGLGFSNLDVNETHREIFLSASKIAKELAKKFRIRRSPFFVSFRKSNKNDLKLIEVHLDLGGDLLIEKLFPKSLSIDFVSVSVNMAIGEDLKEKIVNYPVAIIFNKGVGSLYDRGSKQIRGRTFEELSEKIIKEIG